MYVQYCKKQTGPDASKTSQEDRDIIDCADRLEALKKEHVAHPGGWSDHRPSLERDLQAIMVSGDCLLSVLAWSYLEELGKGKSVGGLPTILDVQERCGVVLTGVKKQAIRRLMDWDDGTTNDTDESSVWNGLLVEV